MKTSTWLVKMKLNRGGIMSNIEQNTNGRHLSKEEKAVLNIIASTAALVGGGFSLSTLPASNVQAQQVADFSYIKPFDALEEMDEHTKIFNLVAELMAPPKGLHSLETDVQSMAISSVLMNLVAAEVSIPDLGLRAAIIDQLNADFDLGIDTSNGVRTIRLTRGHLWLLTELNASDRNIVNLTGLNHAVRLINLDLSDNNIGNNNLAANGFNRLTNLETLNLSGNRLTNTRAVNSFAGLERLRELNLSNNNISGFINSGFSALTELKRLDLSNNNISSTNLANNTAYVGLGNLKELDLSNNRINNLVANGFNQLTTLEYLNLSYNALNNTGAVNSWTNLGNLRRLNLSNNNNIQSLGVSGIFQHLTNIEKLDLSNNNLNNSHADNLDAVNRYTGLTTLKEFDLSGNSITNVATIEQVFVSLETNVDVTGQEINIANFVMQGPNIMLDLNVTNSRGLSVVNTTNIPLTWDVSVEQDDIVLTLPNFNGNSWIAAGLGVEFTFNGEDLNGNVAFDGAFNIARAEGQAVFADLQDDNLRLAVIEELQAMNVPIRTDGRIFVPQMALLRNLDASDREIINLSGLNAAINLETLDLSDNNLTADSLTANVFNGMNVLETLDLSGNFITTTTATNRFSGLSSLRELNLSDNRITALVSSGFNPLIQLEVLNLNNNALQTVPAASFTGLARVTNLDLGNNTIGVIPANAFNVMPLMEEINLSGNNLTTTTNVDRFTGMSNLETLDLSNNIINTLITNGFERAPSLRVLDLSGNRIPTAEEISFTGLTHLATLNLDGNAITNIVDLEQLDKEISISIGNQIINRTPILLQRFENIVEVGLATTQNEGLVFTAGENMPDEWEVELASNNELLFRLFSGPNVVIDNVGVNFDFDDSQLAGGVTGFNGTFLFETIENEVVVNFPDANLSSVVIEALRNEFPELEIPVDYAQNNEDILRNWLEMLETLDASNHGITDLTGLNQMINLTELDLSGNALTNAQMPANVFNQLSNLEVLNLSGQRGVNDEGEEIRTLTNTLLNRFSGLTSLNELDLSDNGITALEANGFAPLATLTNLNLSGNALTTTNINTVFNGLGGLVELDLSNNNINNAGLIASGFNQLTGLQNLDLSHNSLTSTTNINRFAGLGNLVTLDLSGNNINNAGLIANAFQDLVDLESLDLSNNNLSTITDVNRFTALNNLETLNLSGNNFANILLLADLPENMNVDVSDQRITVTANVQATHFNNVLARILTTPSELGLTITNGENVPAGWNFSAYDGDDIQVSIPDVPNTTHNGVEIGFSYNLEEVDSFDGTIIFNSISSVLNVDVFDDGLREAIVEYLRDVHSELEVPADYAQDNESIPRNWLEMVERLDASNSGVESLTGINQAINLIELDLSDNAIPNTSLPANVFNQLSELEVLDLSSQRGVNADGVEIRTLTNTLANRFAGLVSLQVLDLSDNGIAGTGGLVANAFATTAAPLTNLTTLNLSGNLLTSTNINTVFNGLSNLTTLDLSNNNIGSLVGNGFNQLTGLEDLNLSGNDLLNTTNINAFTNLDSLQILNLSNNNISSLLVNGFNNVPNLTRLDLSENNIINLGGEDRFASLVENLETLDLNGNRIGDIRFLNVFGDDTRITVSDQVVAGGVRTFRHFENSISDVLFTVEEAGLLVENAGEMPDTWTTHAFEDTFYVTIPDAGNDIYTGVSVNFSYDGDLLAEVASFSGVVELGNITTTNAISMPDINLRSVIIETLRAEQQELNIPATYAEDNETIPRTWLELLTKLDASELGITSLVGLNQAVNLIELDLSGNALNNDSLIANGFNQLASLEILNLSGNVNITTTSSSNRFTGLTNLKYLNLSDNTLNTMPANAFNQMTSLQSLNLSNNNLTSTVDVNRFSGLSNLVSLDLSDNNIDNTGLIANAFQNLTGLENLDLSDNNLTSTINVDRFTGLGNLISLNLENNNIHTVIAHAFQRASSLERINLSNNAIINLVNENRFNDLEYLKVLDLSGNGITNVSVVEGLTADINVTGQIINIDPITLNGPHVLLGLNVDTPTLLNIITNATELPAGWTLSRFDTDILMRLPSSDTIWDVEDLNINFAYNRNLQNGSVTFTGTFKIARITGQASGENLLAPIADEGLRNAIIDELRFIGEPIRADNQIYGSQMRLLRTLNASGQGIESLVGINQATNLLSLDLSNNNISAIPIDSFNQLTVLEELNLRNNSITATVNNGFRGLTSLRTLDLSHNNLTNNGASATFNGLTNVTHFDLSHNLMTGLSSSGFAQMTSLQELDLSHNSLPSPSSGAFTGLGNLQLLELNNNLIGTLNSNGFSNLTGLQYLNLSNNLIPNVDNSNRFSGLSNLIELNLSNNSINSLVSNSFSGTPVLENLNLANNNMSDFVAVNRFNGLNNLINFNLDNNAITNLTLLENVFNDRDTAVTVRNQVVNIPLRTVTEPWVSLPVSTLEREGLSITGTSANANNWRRHIHEDIAIVMLPGFNNDSWSHDNVLVNWTVNPDNINGNITFNGTFDIGRIEGNASFVNVPDENLRNVIIRELQYIGEPIRTDRQLFPTQMRTLRRLNAQNSGIVSLTGLNQANRLETINLSGNDLISGSGSIVANAFSGMNQVRNLNLSNNNIDQFPSGSMTGMVNLEHLDVSNQRSVFSVASHTFQPLINLRSINLSHNSMTNTQMPISSLSSNHFLEEINLNNNNFTTLLGANRFSTQGRIRSINASNNNIATIAAAQFASQSNIEYLDLSNNAIVTINPAVFEVLDNLKILDLSDNRIANITPLENIRGNIDVSDQLVTVTDNQILTHLEGTREVVTTMTNQGLSIEHDEVPEGWIISALDNYVHFSLPNATNATHSNIRINFTYNPADLTEATNFNGIINFNTITTNLVINVPDLGLREAIADTLRMENPELNLSDNYAEENTFFPRNWLEKLTTLDASNRGIVTLTGLNQAINLTDIDLSHNDLVTGSITNNIFAGMHHMNSLDLSHNNINQMTWSGSMNGMVNLEHLDISNQRSVFNVASHTFQPLTNLRSINLSNNSMTNTQMPISSLSSNHFLEEIDLSNNYFTTLFGANRFSTQGRIRSINVSNNNIASIAAAQFASQSNIEYLDLSHNAIVTINPAVFEVLGNLKTLDLSNNRIANITPLENISGNIDVSDQFVTITTAQTFTHFDNIRTALSTVNSQGLSIDNVAVPEGWTITPVGDDFNFRIAIAANGANPNIQIAFEYDQDSLSEADSFSGVVQFNSTTTNFVVTIPDQGLRKALVDNLREKYPELDVPDDFAVNSTIFPRDWLEKLTALDASNRGIVTLTGLNQAINLTDIDLSHNDLVAGSITNNIFAGMHHMNSLDLSHNNINQMTWSGSMNGMVNLEHLDISNQRSVFSVASHTFQPLTNLRSINLSHNSMTNTQMPISSLSSNHFLEEIDLSNNYFTTLFGANRFSTQGRIKSINASNNNIASIAAAQFANQSNIEYLDLSNNAIVTINPAVFEVLGNLKTLNLSENLIADITQLEYLFTEIGTEVDVRKQNISLPVWTLFDEVNELELLVTSNNTGLTVLSYDNVPSEWIVTTNGDYIVVSLDLDEAELATDDMVLDFVYADEALEGNVKFDGTINIASTFVELFIAIPDENLRQVVIEHLEEIGQEIREDREIFGHQMRMLTEFDANEREIVNLTGLNFATNLTRLDLSGNRIANANLRVNEFNRLHSLEYLNLSGQRTAAGARSLTSLGANNRFTGLRSLTELNLSNNGINTTGIPANALNQMPQLITLDLSHNLIGTIPTRDRFSNPSVRYLDLSNNVIPNGSWINSHFALLPQLRYLDLSHNLLTDTGTTRFHGMHNLESLNISNNNISGLLANSLLHSENLEHLDLSHNNISQINDGQAFNGLWDGLETLDLRHNAVRNSLALEEFAVRSQTDLLIDLNQQEINIPTINITEPRHEMEFRTVNMQGLEITNVQNLPEGWQAHVRHGGDIFFTLPLNDNSWDSNSSGLGPIVVDFRYEEETLWGIEEFNGRITIGRMHGTAQFVNMPDQGLRSAVIDELNNIEEPVRDDRQLFPFQMRELRELDASGRTIANITGIQTAINLIELDLSHNSIGSLTNAIFNPITRLETLNLSHNEINTTISADFFGPAAASNNLVELDLSHNSIGTINANGFRNLIHLQQLDLSHNNIAAVGNRNLFTGLISLLHLDLSHNALRNIVALEDLAMLATDEEDSLNFTVDVSDQEIIMPRLNLTELETRLNVLTTRNPNNTGLNLEAGSTVPDYWEFTPDGNIIVMSLPFEVETRLHEDIYINFKYDADALEGDFTFNGRIVYTELDTTNIVAVIPDEGLRLAVADYLRAMGEDVRADNAFRLPQMRLVRNLNASGQGVSDLTNIGLMINMQTLDLSDNNIGNLASSQFRTMTQLTELDLSSNNLTTIANDRFMNLTRVQYLNLSNNQIASISAPTNWSQAHAWRGLNNLVELDLSNNNLVNLQSSNRFRLPALTSLDLSNNKITTAGLATSRLTAMPRLEDLDLSGNAIVTINPLAFNGLALLDNLNLNENNISNVIPLSDQRLGHVDNVYVSDQLITINNLQVTNGHEHTISRLLMTTRRQGLDVNLLPAQFIEDATADGDNIVVTFSRGHGNTLNDVAFEFSYDNELMTDANSFSGRIEFNTVDLNIYVVIPDDGLRGAVIDELNTNFDRNIIDDLITFEEIRLIENLDASGLEINDLTGLEHATSLVHLDLSDNDLTNANMTTGSFSTFTRLETLNLSENRISSIANQNVFNGLHNIHELNLSHNNIATLANRSFRLMPNLTTLDLSHNLISNSGIFHSTESNNAFNGLTRLESLDLSNNLLIQIGGSSNIASMNRLFVSLTSLRELDLSHNNIQIANSTTTVNNGFRGLNNLEVLDLSHNNIHTLNHANVFRNLDNVRELDLSHNSLTILPTALLSHVTNIETIDFNNNDFERLPSLTSIPDSLINLIFDENMIRNIISIDNMNVENLSLLNQIITVNHFDIVGMEFVSNNILMSLEGIGLNLSIEIPQEGLDIVSTGSDDGIEFLLNDALLYTFSDLKVDFDYDNIPNFNGVIHFENIHAFTHVPVPDLNLRRAILNELEVEFDDIENTVINLDQILELETLNASGYGVQNLSGLQFARNLVTLDLSDNELKSASNLESISGLSKLTSVDLSDNDITTINSNLFAKLGNVETFNLNNNSIDSLDPGVFTPLVGVNRLDLGGNIITDVYEDVFMGLDNLDAINLSNNHISDITSLYNVNANVNAQNQTITFERLMIPSEVFVLPDILTTNAGSILQVSSDDLYSGWIIGSGPNDAIKISGVITEALIRNMSINFAYENTGNVTFSGSIIHEIVEANFDFANIPDDGLRTAIIIGLGGGIDDFGPDATITVAQMRLLENLNASGFEISDLTGLEHAVNVVGLDLSQNLIDNSALAGFNFDVLESLEQLNLSENGISDITSLEHLTLAQRIIEAEDNEYEGIEGFSIVSAAIDVSDQVVVINRVATIARYVDVDILKVDSEEKELMANIVYDSPGDWQIAAAGNTIQLFAHEFGEFNDVFIEFSYTDSYTDVSAVSFSGVIEINEIEIGSYHDNWLVNPDNGAPIHPETGWDYDPETGFVRPPETDEWWELNPDTEAPIHPETGWDMDADTGLIQPPGTDEWWELSPDTDMPVHPETGWDLDPETGLVQHPDTNEWHELNEDTNMPVHPETGWDIDVDNPSNVINPETGESHEVNPDTDMPMHPDNGWDIDLDSDLENPNVIHPENAESFPVDEDGNAYNPETGNIFNPETGNEIHPDTGWDIDPENPDNVIHPDSGESFPVGENNRPMDPETGIEFDPETGWDINPDSDLPIHPETGWDWDAEEGMVIHPDSDERFPIDEGGNAYNPETENIFNPESGNEIHPENGWDINPETPWDPAPDADNSDVQVVHPDFDEPLDVNPDTGNPLNPDNNLDINPDTGNDMHPDNGWDINPETPWDPAPDADNSDVQVIHPDFDEPLDVNPDTGNPLNPDNNLDINPDTGNDMHPENGFDINPETPWDPAPDADNSDVQVIHPDFDEPLNVNPETGNPLNPDNNLDINPETGNDMHPDNGFDINPETPWDPTPDADNSDVQVIHPDFEEPLNVNPDGNPAHPDNGWSLDPDNEGNVLHPENGESFPVDENGNAYNPDTGNTFNPETGNETHPQIGWDLDPENPGHVINPFDPDGPSLPANPDGTVTNPDTGHDINPETGNDIHPDNDFDIYPESPDMDNPQIIHPDFEEPLNVNPDGNPAHPDNGWSLDPDNEGNVLHPENGESFPVDEDGHPYNPETGNTFNPETGNEVHPELGWDIDPEWEPEDGDNENGEIGVINPHNPDGNYISDSDGNVTNVDTGNDVNPETGNDIHPELGWDIDPEWESEDGDNENGEIGVINPHNPDGNYVVDSDGNVTNVDTGNDVNPETGNDIHPELGWDIDPENPNNVINPDTNESYPVNPETGNPIHPETGWDIDVENSDNFETPNVINPSNPDGSYIIDENGNIINEESGNTVNPETGNDINSEAGNDINPETGNDINSETGNDINSDTGNDINSETGNDINSDTGNDINSDTGNDINPETGNDINSETGNDINPETGNDIHPELGWDIDPENPGHVIHPDTDMSFPVDENGNIYNPETGNIFNPHTGNEIDPETGWDINPDTGDLIDPETQLPISPTPETPETPETPSVDEKLEIVTPENNYPNLPVTHPNLGTIGPEDLPGYHPSTVQVDANNIDNTISYSYSLSETRLNTQNLNSSDNNSTSSSTPLTYGNENPTEELSTPEETNRATRYILTSASALASLLIFAFLNKFRFLAIFKKDEEDEEELETDET